MQIHIKCRPTCAVQIIYFYNFSVNVSYYMYRVSKNKKNFNNFITLRYFFLKFYSFVQRLILHLSAKFHFNIARLDIFMLF